MKRIFLLMFLSINLYSLTPEEILKNADAKRAPAKAFEIKIRVSSFRDEKLIDKVEMKGYVKGKKSMVYFTSPAKWKGRKMLMIDNDVQIIFPNTSKPVRVTPTQRLMGEVANGDIARISYSIDYMATLEGELKVDNKNCYFLKLKAKDSSVTYNSIDFYVEKDSFFPIKAVFYALSGKILKTAYYTEPRELAGIERISKTTIYDAVNTNSYSIMEYLEMEEANISDKYFNINYLMEM